MYSTWSPSTWALASGCPPQFSLILLYLTPHRSLTALGQKASSHSMVITRNREKSSGQKNNLFNNAHVLKNTGLVKGICGIFCDCTWRLLLLSTRSGPAHCNENPIFIFPEKDGAASVPISTFICLWAVYIFPRSVYIFSCSRIDRPMVGIYKSLTDTWIWKLWMRPRNSFSGNICFEFSVLCLCSALLKVPYLTC